MTVPRPEGFPTTPGQGNFAVLVDGSDVPVAIVEAVSVAEAREFFEAIRPLVGVDCHVQVCLESEMRMQVGVPRFGRPYLQMLVAKAERERVQSGREGH